MLEFFSALLDFPPMKQPQGSPNNTQIKMIEKGTKWLNLEYGSLKHSDTASNIWESLEWLDWGRLQRADKLRNKMKRKLVIETYIAVLCPELSVTKTLLYKQNSYYVSIPDF